MRTINVTAGAVEYLTAVVTETTGGDLTDATFEVALGSSRTTPPSESAWQAPDATDKAGPVVKVSLLVDSPDQIGTNRTLWVRVTDTPEKIPLACSERAVTIV